MKEVDEFIKAGNKKRREKREMMTFFHGMIDHISSSTYKLQFHPCDDEKCRFNCAARKQRASPEFKNALRELGGRIPGACPSPEVTDQNATLLDFFSTPDLGGELRGADDQYLPEKPQFGKCEMGCGAYVFQSKSDKDHHELLIHPVERLRQRRKSIKKQQSHACVICQMTYSNVKILREHQRTARHRVPRKRKAGSEV
jgi:hypothetical protein